MINRRKFNLNLLQSSIQNLGIKNWDWLMQATKSLKDTRIAVDWNWKLLIEPFPRSINFVWFRVIHKIQMVCWILPIIRYTILEKYWWLFPCLMVGLIKDRRQQHCPAPIVVFTFYGDVDRWNRHQYTNCRNTLCPFQLFLSGVMPKNTMQFYKPLTRGVHKELTTQ